MSKSAPPRVAVIGAGPVGLEAALYAKACGLPVAVYDRGAIAEHLRRWGHARMFTPFGMNATPLVATSLIWAWIYNPQFGLANWVLHLLHLPTSPWTQGQATSMPAVILFSLWHEVGFTTIVFLGGLAIINDEYSQAARVDGANPWQEFWYITWPQLRPVTYFVVVITTILSLQSFTQFYQLSGGGPNNATTTLSFLVYEESQVLQNTGYAAALAVVLFLITIFFTLVRWRTSPRIGRTS